MQRSRLRLPRTSHGTSVLLRVVVRSSDLNALYDLDKRRLCRVVAFPAANSTEASFIIGKSRRSLAQSGSGKCIASYLACGSYARKGRFSAVFVIARHGDNNLFLSQSLLARTGFRFPTSGSFTIQASGSVFSGNTNFLINGPTTYQRLADFTLAGRSSAIAVVDSSLLCCGSSQQAAIGLEHTSLVWQGQ